MSHNQSTLKAEAVDATQAYRDAGLRIATIMAEANERLFKVQSEAATAALADNSKHLKALLSTTDPTAALTEWVALYQANMRRVLDVTRTCFEILPQTQDELAKLAGGLTSYGKETQQYLDQLTKTMSDGRDAATAQMKDFLSKAAETVSTPPAAKKETLAHSGA